MQAIRCTKCGELLDQADPRWKQHPNGTWFHWHPADGVDFPGKQVAEAAPAPAADDPVVRMNIGKVAKKLGADKALVTAVYAQAVAELPEGAKLAEITEAVRAKLAAAQGGSGPMTREQLLAAVAKTLGIPAEQVEPVYNAATEGLAEGASIEELAAAVAVELGEE